MKLRFLLGGIAAAVGAVYAAVPVAGCGAPFTFATGSGGQGGGSASSSASGSGGVTSASSTSSASSASSASSSGAETCMPPKSLLCSGSCVNPNVDDQNCGGCEVACHGGKTCVSGQCQCPGAMPNFCGGMCTSTPCMDCGAETQCGSACVDTMTDADNCSICGHQCPLGAVCVNGGCSCVGDVMCAGAPPFPGVCAPGGNVPISPDDCGMCGTACDPTQTCAPGTPPACACRPGLTQCATCVDTRVDHANCGGCNQPCLSAEVCLGGHCLLTCIAPAPTECHKGCTNLNVDPLNCGACDNRCNADESCVAGTCKQVFASPYCEQGTCTNGGCAACGTSHKCCDVPKAGQATMTTMVCVAGDTCPAIVAGP